MHIIKPSKLVSLLSSAVLALMARPVLAINSGLEQTGKEAGFQTAGNSANLIVLVGQFINALLGLTGVAFLVLMVYAGVRYMIAQSPDDTKSSIGIIKNSVIGLIIIFASYAIVNFVIRLILRQTTGTA